MKHHILAMAASAFVTVAGSAIAQPAEDPAHEELRTLRKQVIEAITSGDVERTLAFVHPTVVVTWQNHEVVRGHQGLRDFMERMGRDAFRGYRVDPTPDDLTILHGGDTGISFGSSVGEYRLFGATFEFTNRWTATVVRENGRWLLAAYHVSNNVLDNPLLRAGVGGAGVAGIVIGLAIGIVVARRRARRARL
jgi:ketosteroid isomerase-like protein